MSTLEDRIRRIIAATGPIDIASFMALCLSDPQDGYYRKAKPVGADGDFITAPEVSQMFGELIGILILAQWRHLCQSRSETLPLSLCELGPGRGTLMADMIRAISTEPQATRDLSVHLVEINPHFKHMQRETLAQYPHPLHWHETLDTLPEGPIFLVANEFFDCMPIHQWVHHGARWYERVIGLGDDGALQFGLGAERVGPTEDSASTRASIKEGAILERAPASQAVMVDITERLAKRGGAALFIDYGYDEAFALGDTLQAMRNHRFTDVLKTPGQQDLTAHVDFAALKQAARATLEKSAPHDHPLTIHGPVTQADFLLGLGLLERAGQLGAGKSQAEQQALQDAVERLAGPDQMGLLFKVMAILPQGAFFPQSLL